MSSIPPYILAIAGIVLSSLGIGAAVAITLSNPKFNEGSLGRYSKFLESQIRGLFLTTTPREIIITQAAGFSVSVIAFALLGDKRILLLTLVSLLGPALFFPFQQSRRIREIEYQLDGWLLSLANMLRATGSITDAVTTTADLVRAPLRQEIDLLVKELQIGRAMDDALVEMAKRVNSNLLSTFVTTVIIARATGGELPQLLEKTSSSFREMKRLDGVMRTQTAQGRFQLFALGGGPPGLAYLLNRTSPDFFTPAFKSPAGLAALGLAIVLWLSGLFAAKKILSVDY